MEHKFIVLSHSYLLSNSDFGLIEPSVKGKPVYLPHDWYNAMVHARKKNKFVVVKMKAENFRLTEPLEKAFVRR